MEICSDYGSSSNNAGFLTSPLGVGGTTMYHIDYLRGSDTTLTGGIWGGWSGVPSSWRGGATEGIKINTSGQVVVSTLAASTSTPVCFASGNILAACTSLRRYKTDIRTLSGVRAIRELMQLNPVTFTSKTDGRHEMGYIAEEVEKVEPRLATYGVAETRGPKGRPDGSGDDPATAAVDGLTGVDYGHMTALLTAALKAAIVRQRQQQREITALQRQIKSLRAAPVAKSR